MALHGDIEIGPDLHAVWSARRTTALAGDGEHEYDVRVDWYTGNDDVGIYPLTCATFTIRHAYRDGATALAAKVLAEAATYAPPAPDARLLMALQARTHPAP